MPWSNFVGHAHWAKVRWIPFHYRPIDPVDIVQNVVLFVPFGFSLFRVLPAGYRRGRVTILAAVILSASAEFFQVFCHNRFPSTTDVVSNTAGAALGVGVARANARRAQTTKNDRPRH